MMRPLRNNMLAIVMIFLVDLTSANLNETIVFNPGDKANALFKRASITTAMTSTDMPNYRQRLNLVKPNLEFEFFMCSAPKTGCTAWKFFWEYVETGKWWSSDHAETHAGLIHELRPPGVWANHRYKSEIDAMVDKIQKVAITRNPYIRFLSSYQDWLKRSQSDEMQVSFGKFTDEFLKFTEGDENIFEEDLSHIDHVQSISNYCQIGRHEYTILRVEEQSLWFDYFITEYKLSRKMDEYTSHGNLVFSSGVREDSLVKDFIAQIAGKEPWPSQLFKSMHHNGSAGKITQYYTPAIAKKVTTIFYDDMVNFGYPLWDGVADNFRFV